MEGMQGGRTVLITGAAGFIGYHLAERLLREGTTVIGLDNLNAYYDLALKKARLARLQSYNGARFRFIHADLNDSGIIEQLLEREKVTEVVHLAAQAGVRYSIDQPHAYSHSNLSGFLHLLESVRAQPVRHVIYASSSSVYGNRDSGHEGFHESGPTDQPVSLYAATKKANEVMASAYAHLYDIPLTGVRFFTVYGPWGRPDMAYFRFADALVNHKPLTRYANGTLLRDMTYVDDAVEALVRLLEHPPQKNDTITKPAHQLFNVGHRHPVTVQRIIEAVATSYGMEPHIQDEPFQPGDVTMTRANPDALYEMIGTWQTIPFDEGIRRFVEWHRAWRTQA